MTATTHMTLRWKKWSLVIARRALWLNVILLGLLFLGSYVALTLGRLPIGPSEMWEVARGTPPSRAIEHVLINIRIPRLLVTIGAGAALGASGAVFQAISRNPLGSPDIIGFTTGAATGALTWIIVFGGSGANVVLAAMIGALIAGGAVYFLARKHGKVSAYRLVLTGIGVGAILQAINALLLVKGDLDLAISANLWLAGSVDGRDWGHVWPLWAGLIVLFGPMLLGMRPLAMMEMGDDLAGPLGVAVEQTRRWMLLAALLLAALATSATGPIAFVALAAPQLARKLGRSGTQPLVGATLVGACLMLAADLLTRVAPFAITLPIGQVTGIIGGLYLIWLLAGYQRQRAGL
ncbi:FecCD family ABC transporter permease [Loktanella sp. S4079]|uniref:FecCD family ABC transporter permease n=1 Tax=Loktanella sp. S4079 TaxID=579483 RepID=UPI0005FA1FAB|nr:iron chelate uptake ABC transporter family permease subunit [Loktanella sp. S4079]KJZ18619.1 ABC transporter permease [Loktanella sp. S4079]